MARSAKHLPKYAPQTWSYYSPNATDPNQLTNAELVKVIRKAAKAANQRLRALEKSDVINTAKTGAYKYAESQMPGKIKPRFNERPKESADRTTLRHQYIQLREFMTMKSSTVTGVRAIRDARYQTAVKRGFNGTAEQWDMAVRKFFTKAAEKLFDSDKIYNAITNNNTDVLDEIIAADHDDQMSKGQALLDYVRRIT
nr:MAG TPA: hypothetical protein [Caudoviricetes sp.]